MKTKKSKLTLTEVAALINKFFAEEGDTSMTVGLKVARVPQDVGNLQVVVVDKKRFQQRTGRRCGKNFLAACVESVSKGKSVTSVLFTGAAFTFVRLSNLDDAALFRSKKSSEKSKFTVLSADVLGESQPSWSDVLYFGVSVSVPPGTAALTTSKEGVLEAWSVEAVLFEEHTWVNPPKGSQEPQVIGTVQYLGDWKASLALVHKFVLHSVESIQQDAGASYASWPLVDYFGQELKVPPDTLGLTTDANGLVKAWLGGKLTKDSEGFWKDEADSHSPVEVATAVFVGDWEQSFSSCDAAAPKSKAAEFSITSSLEPLMADGLIGSSYYGQHLMVPADTVCISTDRDGTVYAWDSSVYAEATKGHWAARLPVNKTELGKVTYTGSWEASNFYL